MLNLSVLELVFYLFQRFLVWDECQKNQYTNNCQTELQYNFTQDPALPVYVQSRCDY